MHRGTEAHLHSLQIYTACPFPLSKDAAEQRGYFARDLSLNRCGRFFGNNLLGSHGCDTIHGWLGQIAGEASWRRG